MYKPSYPIPQFCLLSTSEYLNFNDVKLQKKGASGDLSWFINLCLLERVRWLLLWLLTGSNMKLDN